MTFAARSHWDAPLAANVVAASYSNSDISGSTCSIEFRADGTVVVTDSAGTSVRYSWKTGGGSSGDYRIRWTNVTGTLSFGTAGTWQTLDTTRTYGVLFNGTGIKSCTGTVEIQAAAAPNTPLDSANISLQAVGEDPGP